MSPVPHSLNIYLEAAKSAEQLAPALLGTIFYVELVFLSPSHADKRWAGTQWDCTSPLAFTPTSDPARLWAQGSFSQERLLWSIWGAADFQRGPRLRSPSAQSSAHGRLQDGRMDRTPSDPPKECWQVGCCLSTPGGIVHFICSTPSPPPSNSLGFFPLWPYWLQARYHLCAAGWLDGERVGYPTAFSSPNCGSGYVGIVDYGRRVNLSETWDVFCYREKGKRVLRCIPLRKGEQQPGFWSLWLATGC